MDEFLSPSARRAVRAAHAWAARLAAREVEPAHLLLAIVDEAESRGATILAMHGVTRESAPKQLGFHADTVTLNAGAADARVLLSSASLRRILINASARSRERGPDSPAGTDTLLLELLATSPNLCTQLNSALIDVDVVRRDLERETAVACEPLTPEFGRLELLDASDTVNVYRILDAAANRAREGLRVLEDFTRFAGDDPLLTAELKSVRHDLKAALDRLPRHELLASRDTVHDVGTQLSTPAEFSRTSVRDVLAANFKRAQEALRTLEEFGKLECRAMAEAIEAARYRLYTLERAALIGAESRERLDGVVLYVLVSSELCRGGLEWTVRESLAGGAQMIQLREKKMPDRELAELARRVRRWTRDAGALFVMNDRPDIARLADADGVHVGQDELSVQDARRIVGSRSLIGVSTHSIEQARAAVLDGANYIGVGPTFPSQTKSFDSFPGLELLRQVHAEIRLPTFAIGGITPDRLDAVLATGARRVAVSAAVCSCDDPRAAAGKIRLQMPS